MAALPEGDSLCVLGAAVHSSAAEFREALEAAWAAFHTRRQLWATRGHLVAKPCALQMSACPCFAWASAERHWTQWEVAQLRIAKAGITGRVAKCFRKNEGRWPNYALHTAASASSAPWCYDGVVIGSSRMEVLVDAYCLSASCC